MQPFKKVLSWLSGIAMVVGSLIEVLQQSGVVFAPETIYGKAIFTAGLVVLFLRNLTADKNNDGVPDILQPGTRGATSMAVILALASLGVVLMACGPTISQVRPGVGLAVVADSIGGQYQCDGAAPDVACFVTVTDSATGAVIVDNARVSLGQVVQLPTRPCLASGRVAYTGRFTGVTASGRLGPVHTVTGGTLCDLAGSGVRGTIILQFRPGD